MHDPALVPDSVLSVGSDESGSARLRVPGSGRLCSDRAFVALLALWLAGRGGYFLAGVRFDAEPLGHAWQFIGRDLLEHDFWRSVWYMHAQPPAFNVLIGAVLRLPFDPGSTFGIIFLVLGLVLVVVLYALLTDLGVGRRTAAVVTALFTCTPAAAIYENYLFYPLPVAVLLCVAALALLRFLRHGRLGAGIGFSAAVAGLALTRSTYHLVWVLGAVVFVALASRRRVPARRLAVALLPMVLVPGLYVKNLVVFDSFTDSTWLGMNLAHMTLNQADDEDLKALVADGTLSPQALIPAFSPLSVHPDDGLRPSGVAVLDQEISQGGLPNFNNRRYIAISDRYLGDSLAYLRARPGEYVSVVGAALRFALLPASDYPFVDRNRAHVHGFDRFASAVLGLQARPFDDRVAILYPKSEAPSWLQISWTAALAYLATMTVGPVVWLWQLIRLRRRRIAGDQERPGEVDFEGIDSARGSAPALDRAALLTLLFVSATVAFAFLSGILLEIGENNRFRFETDPLVLVATTTLMVHAAAVALHRPRPPGRRWVHLG